MSAPYVKTAPLPAGEVTPMARQRLPLVDTSLSPQGIGSVAPSGRTGCRCAGGEANEVRPDRLKGNGSCPSAPGRGTLVVCVTTVRSNVGATIPMAKHRPPQRRSLPPSAALEFTPAVCVTTVPFVVGVTGKWRTCSRAMRSSRPWGRAITPAVCSRTAASSAGVPMTTP